MGREIRIGLMLAAAACLTAVMVDWVVEQLTSVATQLSAEPPQASAEPPQASAEPPRVSETEYASVEIPQQDAGEARDATEGSHVQG